MVLLCSLFSSLLPLFFYGKLSGSKYSSVCALYAEKEQQCLAAGFACRYTTHIVVLFLISETSIHDGGAQCADNSSGGANVDRFHTIVPLSNLFAKQGEQSPAEFVCVH